MNVVKQIRRNKESGIAMLIALVALMLLAILGMGFMFMADTENSVNSNYKDSQKAYFASRAGLENVRALMLQGTNLYTAVSGLTMPAPGGTGMIYIYNPNGAEVVDPTTGANNNATTVALNPYLDDELCQEHFATLPMTQGTAQTPCGATGTATEVINGQQWANYFKTWNPALMPGSIPGTGTATALPFKWVRITNKQNQMGLLGNQLVTAGQPAGAQVCWNGTKETATAFGGCGLLTPNANPVWVLTSLAITPAGSRRMTQMEVALTPPIYPDAAITAEAPVTTVGSSLTVNGYDNCTCNPDGTPKVVGGQCSNQHYAIASGGAISSNGNPTLISSHNPPTETLSPWPYDVPGTIEDMLKTGPVNVSQGPNAVTSCSGTPDFTSKPAVYETCTNITGHSGAQGFGSYPTGLPNSPVGSVPQTTYIPGSVSLHADVTGSGILIIDGDLNVNGGLSWYGLILVRGQISFTGGGSQTVNVYGAILAGEDVNAQSIPIGDKVGGSFVFDYDTCALRQAAPPGPPRLLATHEVMY